LIVPPTARVIYGPDPKDKRRVVVLWDELADREKEYRMKGRPPITFEDEPDDTPKDPTDT
jgi:hypothetical protein